MNTPHSPADAASLESVRPTAPAVDRPRLRTGLAAAQHTDPNLLVIHDPLGIGQAVVVSHLAVEVAQRFDGKATVLEIAESVKIEFPQAQVSPDAVAGLAAAMDEASLLDSARLRARFDGPVRKPSCVGSYAANPVELRAQLSRLFTADGGPGLPDGGCDSPERLRAVLVPHMDYGRGNITYGHGFKELIENSPAEVFVIIGTSHYSNARFTLSRQHFDTPLGLVETDTDYVDRIAADYGEGVYEDPLAHIPEHAIELEVVLLRFLLADRRPFKIVPLLVGSFGDCLRGKANPGEADDIASMVRALRAAEATCSRPVCYVISGDLAHIGPKFGDKRKAEEPWMAESRTADARILKTLEAANPGEFFDEIAADKNARRICGLSPTWLTLDVTRPKVGKVLHYQQYVQPEGKESVSFAAAAFYG